MMRRFKHGWYLSADSELWVLWIDIIDNKFALQLESLSYETDFHVKYDGQQLVKYILYISQLYNSQKYYL